MPSTPHNKSNQPLLLTAGIAGAALAGLWLKRRAAHKQHTFIHPQLTEPRGRVLITGASSGIGSEFAHQLAALGYDLIIVARRENRLQELAAELTRNHPVQVTPFPADLTDDRQLAELEVFIGAQPPLTLLINGAGFGTRGLLAQVDIDKQVEMTSLHVFAPLRLTKAVLPGMLSQRFGGIINISSIAAYVPMPENVSYSATKAYLKIFSEALQMELDGTGVIVQALCPGFFYSGFHDTEEYQNYRREVYPKFMWKTAAEVASVSLQRLGNGEAVVIPGLQYKGITMLAANTLTRPIVKGFIQHLYRTRRRTQAPAVVAEPPGSLRQNQV